MAPLRRPELLLSNLLYHECNSSESTLLAKRVFPNAFYVYFTSGNEIGRGKRIKTLSVCQIYVKLMSC